LADLFPRMTEAEFTALVEDIKANGLRQPIVLYQGKILDGRHRQDAAKLAGRELAEKDFTEFKAHWPRHPAEVCRQPECPPSALERKSASGADREPTERSKSAHHRGWLD
jgi:hypothetical protein